MGKKTIRTISVLTIIAFVLHIIWENTQAPLYLGYKSFSQHFLPCFFGTIGDVIITLFVYGLVSLLKREALWIVNLGTKDIFTLSLISFFVAVWIEQNALFIGKWGYASSMPLIPYFNVSLTPILQMMILLPLSVYLTGKFVVKTNN